MKIGYKYYDAEKKPVLFPFGFGLSYTTYRYASLAVTQGDKVKVSFTLTNSGTRPGARSPKSMPASPSAEEPPKRLIGFSKVELKAGEKKTVDLEIDPKYLSIFDEAKNRWTLLPGEYTILVGGSSQTLPLKATLSVK